MEFLFIFGICCVLGCVCAATVPLVSTGVVAAFTAHPFLYLVTSAVVFTALIGLGCIKLMDR